MRSLFAGLCLLSMLGLGTSASAQPLSSADRPAVFAPPSEPAEWGAISPALIRTNHFPADSNATALILSDFGDARFRFNGEVEVERHTRVKILTEGGYDKGTVTIPYYVADRMQRIVDLEGVTYTLGSDGSVVEHELADDDVFVETIRENWEQVSFTLPSLSPGAVIEYRYKLRSKNFFRIPTWTFQHDEPALLSAYEVTIPPSLEFVFLTRGSQNYTRVDENFIHSPGFDGKSMEKRWTMTDVPALREEPFMTTAEDYRSRIQLQISRFRNPRTGVVEQDFMGTWPETAELLLDHNDFGDDLGKDRDLQRQVESITEGLSTEAEKVEAIYDFVCTAMTWDGTDGWLLTRDLEDALAAKRGSSADINLLLVSMLQHADIEAHPVLTSTRGHGRLMPLYPILEQFNYVLAGVPSTSGDAPDSDAPDEASGESMRLFDATDPFVRSPLLPKRALNRQAWVVSEDNPQWIEVSPAARQERSVVAYLTLSTDGSVDGSVTVTDDGYAAANSRRSLAESDDETFAQTALLKGLAEASLSSVEIGNREDLEAPMTTTLNLSVPAYAQTAGDMVYVNPTLLPYFSENPFKQPTRTFPVDFAYPSRTTYTVSMEIPEGYEVQDLPQPQRLALPQKAGSYVQLAQVVGRRLTMRSVLSIDAPVVSPELYPALRDLVDRVVAAQSEVLVLKRTAAPTAADEK